MMKDQQKRSIKTTLSNDINELNLLLMSNLWFAVVR